MFRVCLTVLSTLTTLVQICTMSFSFIIRSTLRSVKTLSISKLNQTNIPPKEVVTYNKETQTPVFQKSTESGAVEFYFTQWFKFTQ